VRGSQPVRLGADTRRAVSSMVRYACEVCASPPHSHRAAAPCSFLIRSSILYEYPNSKSPWPVGRTCHVCAAGAHPAQKYQILVVSLRPPPHTPVTHPHCPLESGRRDLLSSTIRARFEDAL
jgi:hypothetical protein